jgi:hypothetical protein
VLREGLSGTLQDMRLAWEEPFGPVVPVVRVKTVEEAVDHCNANNLALQGCVFTRDVDAGVSLYFVFHPPPLHPPSAPVNAYGTLISYLFFAHEVEL